MYPVYDIVLWSVAGHISPSFLQIYFKKHKQSYEWPYTNETIITPGKMFATLQPVISSALSSKNFELFRYSVTKLCALGCDICVIIGLDNRLVLNRWQTII